MPVPWLLEVHWQSLAILGSCFITLTSALHRHMVFSLRVCPNFPFFYKDTRHIELGPTQRAPSSLDYVC